MTVYLGKNPVGVGRIVEKKVAKEKFGATVDAFLGDVDADGNYIKPTEPTEINLVGVKNIPSGACSYAFAHSSVNVFNANDIEILGNNSFERVFYYNTVIQEAHFDKIEQITANSCFNQAFMACTKLNKVTFNKLKICNGNQIFAYIFGDYNNNPFDISKVFPVLEEINGMSTFGSFISYSKYINNNISIKFPSLKKIVGFSAAYGATFGSVSLQNTVWHFPSATEFTGYIWNAGSSYASEIHFAAANQTAIEACDGYANKWGFAGATIYFDL